MAERTYVTGAVAIGVVAAALHLSTASAPAPSPGSSTLGGGAHVRHATTAAKSGFDQVLWNNEMKDHPEKLGKLTAQQELTAAINEFSATGTLDVMIAIEPDPVHTQLALWFDRDIDALEDALQKSGYQYQSNWLPWSPPSSAASSSDDFVGEEKRRLFLQGRENYPGVILFRPERDAQKHPLAVFLVGNSPTAGIDRTQFEEALSQLKNRAPEQTELRILGPTFTGSGPSFRAILSGKAVSDLHLKKITIASGSVSDSDCAALLPAGKTEGYLCSSPDLPGASFVSFGIDKEWRTKRVRDFLHRQGGFELEQIAELTESESSYGLFSEKAPPQGNPPPEPLQLHFPRNISHLRSAYQRNNIFGFGVSAQGSGNISLNLDFNEANDDDALPSFAEQQMPVSQDGVMHKITEVLERRRIKVVVLSATDVLDELFVAEILARQAPNTLVVINQADNLFLRSSSPDNFAGMYFVSPWPLIHDVQPGDSSPVFPSDLAEGLYAAVQYLYPPQGELPYIPDYGSPLSPASRPPLWLSAVGHGNYWPVALLDDPDGRSPFQLPAIPHQDPAKGSFHVIPAHLSQDLLLLFLCLFALYHTAKCLELAALQEASFGYNIIDAAARTPKLWLQLCMTVLLLLLLELSISPFYAYALTKDALYFAGAALWVAGAYLVCLILVPSLNPRAPANFSRGARKRSGAISAILAVAALAGVIYEHLSWHHLWDWLSLPSGFAEFFKYRASYPLRGISPVFPLFLSTAALFILIHNHLDRIAFTPNMRPRLPDPVDDLPDCPNDDDLKPLTGFLAWPPSLRTISIKLAILTAIVALVWASTRTLQLAPRMFDGSSVQTFLGAAMFLLVVAVLWELAMAAVLWEKLKSLCLERLESSSLRRGFSSISGITWSGLWIFRGSRPVRYRAIYRLLEQAARDSLHEEACPAQAGPSPTPSPNLDTATRALHKQIASHSDPQLIVQQFGIVQQQIAAVAAQLLVKLRVGWLKEKDRITASDTAEESGASVPQPSDPLQQLREEWVALVYVHYVRMVLLQIRSRLITAPTLYLFLVWAATCYPYLNQHVLRIALAALLGFLSFGAIFIYASINRDPILSRTTNHRPGRLDFDFYLKTVSVVGVPLIAFVASQFPEVSSFLFSWIEPGMTAAR